MKVVTGYVGIDVGGTTAKGGLVQRDGTISHFFEESTVQGNSEFPLIDQIERLFRQVHLLAGHDVFGLGICLPGGVNGSLGQVYSLTNVPGWKHKVDLVEILKSRIPVETIAIDNDANCAGLAEYQNGAGAGSSNLVYLTLSTGLGGALISHGRVHRGRDGTGAELGHIIIHPEGALCGCGKKGHAEAYVSGTGLVRTALRLFNKRNADDLQNYLWNRNVRWSALTAQHIGEAAREGIPSALRMFSQMGRNLGILLVDLCNSYNPDTIVFGGGLMKSQEFFIHQAIAYLEENAFGASGDVEVRTASLQYPGIVGAAALVSEKSRTQ